VEVPFESYHRCGVAWEFSEPVEHGFQAAMVRDGMIWLVIGTIPDSGWNFNTK
jgi:hypothetical protein